MTVCHDRQPVLAYIGLGSNLAEPVQQIQTARLAIAGLSATTERAFSCLYRSPPMGPQDQPDYVNAVMAIATALPAIELLQALQGIESDQGRVRTGLRWGARTLDLDILLYADQQIAEPNLIVPHPGIAERAFVLYPLYEIAPDLRLPGYGVLSDLLARCPANGLQRLSQ